MKNEKMSKECYDKLVKIIEKHLIPMYFDTRSPILCIVGSEARKMEKEIRKELVED